MDALSILRMTSSSPLSINLSGPYTPTPESKLVQYKAESPPEKQIQKGMVIQSATGWGSQCEDRDERIIIGCQKWEGGVAAAECGRQDHETGEITERFFIILDGKDIHTDHPIHSDPAHSFIKKLFAGIHSMFCCVH